MTAEDVQALLARIHSAIEHQDYDNVVWFVELRDEMFNDLSPGERMRYIAWARARIAKNPDPWCIPGLWMSAEHRAAMAADEAARRSPGDAN